MVCLYVHDGWVLEDGMDGHVYVDLGQEQVFPRPVAG